MWSLILENQSGLPVAITLLANNMYQHQVGLLPKTLLSA
jgi:hypothetical protein